MKLTQEQVIAWAREAKLYADDYADPNVHDDWFKLNDLHFATLAYEAGRKDENEACVEVCELMYDYGWLDAKRCAREIRARREQ